MLPIAEIIRNKRREKNVTQDELAQALGVTFQSVSRWETGVAYPDIELLPSIALFFGITTDELLGANEEARRAEWERKVEEACVAFWDVKSPKERFDIATKAYKELNYTFFAVRACLLIVEANVLPREEGLPLLRELVEEIFNKPGELHSKLTVIKPIYKYEDEDRLEEWNKYIADPHAIRKLLAQRYAYHNDVERTNRQRQINLWYSLSYSFDCDFGKRHAEWYNDPLASIEGQNTILSIIDTLRDSSVEIDAWIYRRAVTYLRLSAAYFAIENKDEGYKTLEKSIKMFEDIFKLPKEQELSFNHPVLDKITVSVSTDFVPDKEPRKYHTNGLYYYTDSVYQQAIVALTDTNGWAWFDSVRDEEKFKSCVARIEKFKPADFKN